ncbi:MAG: HlyC/CorC family transporter [Silvanigrellales bacterium]|nr:HlyC/CorC family transporter [Silvanigrellales bacterium]
MNEIMVEFIVIGVLLFLNGLFSMSEMAIVSAKKSRLSQWADAGHSGARHALRLGGDPGNFLSTVQIGITLVAVLSGVFSGARAAEAIEAWILANVPLLGSYAEGLGVTVMVGMVTFLSIVVGELVPKRIALHSPEKIAAFLATPMDYLSKFAYPLVQVLDFSTRFLLRLVGRHGPVEEVPVTEQEIKNLVEQGTHAGVFEPAEKEMMDRVLTFSDKSIHSMMTPRHDVVWIDVSAPFSENRGKITSAPHSHFPVVRDSLDAVIGTAHIKDIYAHDISSSQEFSRILTPPLFIPESSGALHVIEMFKRTGVHIAFIIDEYGSVQGLVTITDLLEALVGDLPSGEPEDLDIVVREDGSALVDGMIPIEDFKRHFVLDELPGEEKGGFQTVAGFLLSSLGRIPRTGDVHTWDGMRFEVIDMDGNRIDKLLVSRAEGNSGDAH